MTLVLATLNGAAVASVPVKRRYWSCAGDLMDGAQVGARPTLYEARVAHRAYERMIAEEPIETVRAMLVREARELADAILDCCAQRRAAGWLNPEDADRTPRFGGAA